MRLASLAFCPLLFASVAAHADTLYSTGFEAPGFTVGQLAGQGGFFQSTVGRVENSVAYAGSQAVVFNAAGTSGQNIDGLPISFTATPTNNIVTLQTVAMFTSASSQTAFEVLEGLSSSAFLDQLEYSMAKRS